MANRYANLVPSKKIKDDFQNINVGFDRVQADVDSLQSALTQEVSDRKAAVQAVDKRVDNIIQGGGPDKDPELVDIRTPNPNYTPQRTINVAGDLTRDMQQQFVAHKAETATGTIRPHGMGRAAAQDYEEGTWTPTFAGGAVAGINTYSRQDGSYVRIGKAVYVKGRLKLNVKDSAMSGALQIRGFPFAPKDGAPLSVSLMSLIDIPTGQTGTYLRVEPSASAAFYSWGDNSAFTILNVVVVSNDTEMEFSGMFQIN